jgi:hypothetical protein
LFRYLNSDKGSWAVFEMVPFITAGAGLMIAGVVNKAVYYIAGGWGSPIIMDGSMEFSDAIKVQA